MSWFEKKKVYYLDLMERVAWTLFHSTLGVIVDTSLTGDITWRTVAVAGASALIKSGLVAPRIGDPNSAATLPSPPDDTATEVPR